MAIARAQQCADLISGVVRRIGDHTGHAPSPPRRMFLIQILMQSRSPSMVFPILQPLLRFRLRPNTTTTPSAGLKLSLHLEESPPRRPIIPRQEGSLATAMQERLPNTPIIRQAVQGLEVSRQKPVLILPSYAPVTHREGKFSASGAAVAIRSNTVTTPTASLKRLRPSAATPDGLPPLGPPAPKPPTSPPGPITRKAASFIRKLMKLTSRRP